ncbi:uncharacterized protein LOC109705729 isoform X2 [Ananas comosus]|uniref:Uncharacterized protein LOC109705729 isoform X2 n=1 Tax=Ananas comosus TaxID=4615 RepID=A0A6P5EL43_ANACO|nr:uncharacterized protein LOC109705729 isoform X2 [Ananas comosus]
MLDAVGIEIYSLPFGYFLLSFFPRKGLSCAAVTQAENMDAESSATCSAIAYQPYEDMSKTSDFSVKDDAMEHYYKQEAIRLVNFTKTLYSLDSVDFYRCPVDLHKELEMKGLIPPNFIGAEECIRLRCTKSNIVHYYDTYYKLVEKLCDLAPYMQWNHEIGKQVEWLKEKGHLTSLCDSTISEYEICLALEDLHGLFFDMYWRFHPLIIEGYRDDLLKIIKRMAGAKRQTVKQTHEEFSRLLPPYGDFTNNLLNKCKETSPHVAKQVALHGEFDSHLDSCESIQHDSSINELLEDETVVTRQFSLLEKELVKESLNAKIYMLKKVEEVESYFTCLESLVRRRLDGRDDFDKLVRELAKEGLFEFSNLPTDKPLRKNWSPEFYELLDNARHSAFPHLPDHYVINGLLDYSFFFSLNDEHHESETVEDCLAKVEERCDSKCFFLRKELWRTKYYTNPIYEQFGDALKLIDLPQKFDCGLYC